MKNEPSDPVERADQRRATHADGNDVRVEKDGTVTQREHGSIDETMTPKGKEHPSEGPYTPEHDGVDPDFEPPGSPGHRPSKGDLGA